MYMCRLTERGACSLVAAVILTLVSAIGCMPQPETQEQSLPYMDEESGVLQFPRTIPEALAADRSTLVLFTVRAADEGLENLLLQGMDPVSERALAVEAQGAVTRHRLNNAGKEGDLLAGDGVYSLITRLDTTGLSPEQCLRFKVKAMLRGKAVASSPITICVTGFPLQDLGSDRRESNLVQSGKALETAVANDILIQFRSGDDQERIKESRIREIVSSVDGKVVGAIFGLQLYKVRLNRSVASFEELLEATRALAKFREVELAAPNNVGAGSAWPLTLPPNDPEFSTQGYLASINATTSWKIARGGDTSIAVIDTGADPSHTDLDAKFNPTSDFQLFGPDVTIKNDSDGHGTHVAGIAAAETNNSTGIASVAPDSPLLIMKIDNDIIGWENFRIQSAINSAHAAGAKIINVSGGVVQALSEPVCSAVSGTPGALVVGAAGNYNPGGAFPDIFKTAVQFPARCTGALAVGAVMPSAGGWTVLNASGLASVEGPDVEIVAPGLNIRSSEPGNSYGNRTGTSFATPMVAGAAAVLSSQGVPVSDIKSRIISNGSSVSFPGGAPMLDLFKALCPLATYPAPTVSGQTPANAESALLAACLVLESTSEESSPQSSGTVLRLTNTAGITITPGTALAPGTHVRIVVSSGPAPNRPPNPVNPGSQINNEGAVISISIVATDPDGDPLSYSASNLPSGLGINSSSGLISGTIDFNAASASPYSVTVTVTDGTISVPIGFTWTVNNTNHTPQVTNPGNQANVEGSTVSLQIPASDPDAGDILVYSASGLPSGLAINTTTGLISGTLTAGSAGNHSVTVTVADNATPPLSAGITFQWLVSQASIADIIQVLDRSGSMQQPASATSSDTKLAVLKSAATHFISMMMPGVGHGLGVVQFNHQVIPFTGPFVTHLDRLSAQQASDLSGAVNTMSAGGMTSIGAGLGEAHNQFIAHAVPGSQRSILLVTDGRENSAPMISAVQASLVSGNTKVYPLGLGFNTSVDAAKLANLASVTGSDYRITADPMEFHKFFLAVLADAVDWDMVVDPMEELSAGAVKVLPVALSSAESSVIFTAFWENLNDAVSLRVISPSGKVFEPSTRMQGLRAQAQHRFAFVQLDLPRIEALGGDWAGVWKLELLGNPVIGNHNRVRYASSVLSRGGARLRAHFDRLLHETGDRASLQVKLTNLGKPVTGADVQANCVVESAGIGKLLQTRPPVTRQTPSAPLKLRVESAAPGALALNPDIIALAPAQPGRMQEVTSLDRVIADLKSEAANVLREKQQRLRLFDDGGHGDGKPNDGVYGQLIPELHLAGSYVCRFAAMGIGVGEGLRVQRETTLAFHAVPKLQSVYSDVNAERVGISKEGVRYLVTVTPRDRYDNYAGPGHPVSVIYQTPDGRRVVDLTDNLNGTYSGELVIPQAVLEKRAAVGIFIDDGIFTELKLR